VEPLGGSENAIKTLPDALLLRFHSEKASGGRGSFGQVSGKKALPPQLAA
jgi:stalled ribosome alternative rescue factor ArfA